MKVLIAATAVVLLSFSGPGLAQSTSGNKLVEACQDNKKPAYVGCEAYILGIVDARGVILRDAPCFPQGVTYSQIVTIAKKYLSDHPADLHRPASELIFKSLEGAYQCTW